MGRRGVCPQMAQMSADEGGGKYGKYGKDGRNIFLSELK
jgi:hypothetical protein